MVFSTVNRPPVMQVEDYFRMKAGDSIPGFAIHQPTSINLSGLSANVVIARTAIVPQRFRGRIEDANINFSTTGTGVLMIVLLQEGGSIYNNITEGIANDVSGLAFTDVPPGFAVGVAIQTAGTGTMSSIDFSGSLRFMGEFA